MNYGAHVPRTCTYGATQVVNAYERYSFEAQLPLFSAARGAGVLRAVPPSPCLLCML